MPNQRIALDTRSPAEVQRLACLYAAAAFGIALLAQVGWLFGARFLAGKWGELPPMAPSTALAFLLLAGGVFSHARWPAIRLSRVFALAAAVLPALVGLLVLARFFTGFDSGVELALSRTSEVLGHSSLGRMALLTAAGLLLESAALLLVLQAGKWRVAASMGALFAVLGTAAGLVVLVAYAYDTPLWHGSALIRVALPTALALLLIGLAESRLTLPGAPALRDWSAGSTRGMLLRAFLPGVLLVIFFDGWLESTPWTSGIASHPLWHALESLVMCAVMIAICAWTARRIGQAIEQSQDALEKSRSLHAESERIGKVGGWELDIDTQQQVWTEEVYRIHEVDSAYKPTVSKAIGFCTPTSRPIIERAVQRAIHHNEPFDVELEILTARGNLRWIHAIGKPDLNRRKVVGFFQDITEHKRAEDALSKSEERFRLSMEATSDGLWDWTILTDEAYFSPANYSMLGYDDGSSPTNVSDWMALIHPDDYERVQRARADCIEGRTGHIEVEYRMRARNGEWRWILGRGKCIVRDSDGRAIRLVGTQVDITEHMRAQEELLRNQALLRVVLDGAPVPIYLKDREGRVLMANPVALQTVGKQATEVLGKTSLEYIDDPETGRAIMEHDLRVMESGVADSIEYAMPGPAGSRVFVSAKSPYRDLEGRVIGVVVVSRDITAGKRAEEELRENERRLNSIYNTVSDVIFHLAVEPEGRFRFVSVNAAFLRVTGLGKEAVVGKTVDEVIPKPSLTMVLEKYRQAIEQNAIVYWEETSDYPVGRLSGEVSVAPVYDEKGRCTHLVGSVHDVTNRKQAEQEAASLQLQLAQAQKMESIGRLVGGIAHDFSNLMSVILLHGDLALQELASGDPLTEPVTAMLQAANRAVEMTRQLMTFSRKQVPQTEVLNLNSLAAECEKLVRPLIGEDIHLAVIPGSRLGLVKADAGQLSQIIMNMAVNSRDAMPDGGSLTIETADFELDEAHARANPDAKPGSYVMLAVRDTGIGMDKETQARVFDPFFTTKEVGKGTGLGLSMVYGIVKQSGGFVILHSELGLGAEFQIYLPAVLDTPEAVLAAEMAPEERGVGTILVVEDETALRNPVRRLLEGAGYRVLVSRDTNDAIQIALRHHGAIDLLLTDVVMPDMSGPQLAEHLHPLYPRMKVLYMSGYPEPRQPNSALPWDVDFIQKPFTKQKLLHRLREVLEDVKLAD